MGGGGGGNLSTTLSLVDYSHFEIIAFPSDAYDEIEFELRELYRLCEPDELDFKPLMSPSQLIVGYSQGQIASFLVVSDTLEIQRKYPEDFEQKGGILGSKGLFIASGCGNNKKYYGLLEKLGANLKSYAIEKGYAYLLLHVSSTRPWLIPKYEQRGFQKSGEFVENGETFSIMRGTLAPFIEEKKEKEKERIIEFRTDDNVSLTEDTVLFRLGKTLDENEEILLMKRDENEGVGLFNMREMEWICNHTHKLKRLKNWLQYNKRPEDKRSCPKCNYYYSPMMKDPNPIKRHELGDDVKFPAKDEIPPWIITPKPPQFSEEELPINMIELVKEKTNLLQEFSLSMALEKNKILREKMRKVLPLTGSSLEEFTREEITDKLFDNAKQWMLSFTRSIRFSPENEATLWNAVVGDMIYKMEYADVFADPLSPGRLKSERGALMTVIYRDFDPSFDPILTLNWGMRYEKLDDCYFDYVDLTWEAAVRKEEQMDLAMKSLFTVGETCIKFAEELGRDLEKLIGLRWWSPFFESRNKREQDEVE